MTARERIVTGLDAEVRAEFAAEAQQRWDTLTAVGFPSSPLWLKLERPTCDHCGDAFEPSKLWAYKQLFGVKSYICLGCKAAFDERQRARRAQADAEEADRKFMEMGRGWR